MAIIADKINSSNFMYHREDKIFVAEVSELPPTFNLRSRIWNISDSCGFVMISEKTDRKLIFVFDKTDFCNDEICGWYFKALSHDKQLSNIRCLIIND